MNSTLKPKNWNDFKLMIAAISVTSTLGLWTLFAGTNRQGALAKAALEQTSNPAALTQIQPSAPSAPSVFNGKILLGGPAPQLNNPAGRRNNNSGGGVIAQTRSS